MPVLREILEVPQGPEVVFDAVADFSNSARWDPGVVAAERVGDGATAPSGVGAVYRLTVTSGGMYTQALRLDDLQMEREPYVGTVAYARAKRAQVVLTRLWAARERGTTVVVNAMHPGWADTPGIRAALPRFHRLVGPLLRSPDQGADTIVWLAASAEAAGSTGKLWLDRRPRAFDRFARTRVSAVEARRLWDICLELTAQPGGCIVSGP